MKFWLFVFYFVGLSSMFVEAEAGEVRAYRYNGSLVELESSLKASGYSDALGFFVKNGGPEHAWKTDTNLMGREWCLRVGKESPAFKRCVYAIQAVVERDRHGKPKFITEDALDFSPVAGFDFLDEAYNCSVKETPNRSVVVIAHWTERKAPHSGGYADTIEQAWIVDPESRKFVEISPGEVVCEINEDRD